MKTAKQSLYLIIKYYLSIVVAISCLKIFKVISISWGLIILFPIFIYASITAFVIILFCIIDFYVDRGINEINKMENNFNISVGYFF